MIQLTLFNGAPNGVHRPCAINPALVQWILPFERKRPVVDSEGKYILEPGSSKVAYETVPVTLISFNPATSEDSGCIYVMEPYPDVFAKLGGSR